MPVIRNLFAAVVIFALCAVLPRSAAPASPDPAVDYPVELGVEAGEQWREQLGLSAEQVRKFTILEKEKEARLKPLRELLRGCMVQLQAQLAEGAPENDVRDLLNQLLQIRKAIAERSERLDSGRAAFLSPTQHARLVVWQALGGMNGYAARRAEAAGRQETEHEKE